MKIFFALTLFFISFTAFAESYDDKLKELFSLTGIKSSYNNIHGYVLKQIQSGFYQAANQNIDAKNLDDEQKKQVAAIVDKRFEQMVKDYETLIQTELPYEKAETEIYIPLFKEVYSEEEIQQLLDFYKSPIGKKSLETTTSILDKASEKTSEQLKPKYQEFVESKIEENIDLMKKEMSEKGLK